MSIVQVSREEPKLTANVGLGQVETIERLARAPIIVFLVVAGIDGKVDKKEIAKFGELLQHAHYRLLQESIEESGKSLVELMSGLSDPLAELTAVATVLDKCLPSELAAHYKVLLIKLATQIAEASGGFLGVFGSKISKQEKLALVAISQALGLMTSTGELAPAAQNLAAKGSDTVPLGNTYPVLKPADWAEQSRGKVVQMSIFQETSVSPGEPVVAYAVDSDETIAFINVEDIKGDADRTRLRDSALANLERRLTAAAQWVELEFDTGVAGIGVVKGLRYYGDYYCAEALLCPAIIKQAHERMNSALLMAVTPVRGQLFITQIASEDNPEPARLLFVRHAMSQYFNPREAPIATNVWVLRNGKVAGQLLGSAYHQLVESARQLGEQSKAEQAKKLEHSASMATLENTRFMLIDVTAHDIEVMLHDLQHVIRHYVRTAAERDDYDGQTHVRIRIADPACEEGAVEAIKQAVGEMLDFLQKQFITLQVVPKGGAAVHLSHSLTVNSQS